MTILIILNSISHRKKVFYKKLYPALAKNFLVEVWETNYAGHAEELAAKASKDGFTTILAAGGDGTLHQVVNGILNSGVQNSLTLGLIPLGSGNDFARTCGLKPDSKKLTELLAKNKSRQIDIGLAALHDKNGITQKRFFINECSLGMGPEVVRRLNEEENFLGPSLTYLKAIVTTFFSHQPKLVKMQTENHRWSGKARAVAIANGKCFGHSIYIAPDAELSDGTFNTFTVGDISLPRFLVCLQQIKSPKKLKEPLIEYSRARSITVTSPEILPVEAEGELIGFTPLHVEVLPGRINFLY